MSKRKAKRKNITSHFKATQAYIMKKEGKTNTVIAHLLNLPLDKVMDNILRGERLLDKVDI